MTAKPDHEAAAASSPAEQGADADGGSAATPRTLPTIIVDPSLVEHGQEAPLPAQAPAHQNGTNGGAHPQTVLGQELSIEDADRFAANIRASWEPPPGSEPAPAAPAPVRAPAADAMPDAANVRLPGSKRSGLLITGAAVLTFFALGALGLSSSRVDVPANAAQRKQPVAAAGKPEPAKPAAAPAPVTPAPAVPAPEPEAVLSQESAATAEAQQGATPAPAVQPELPLAAVSEPSAGAPVPGLPEQPPANAVSPTAPAIAVAPGEPSQTSSPAPAALPPAPEPKRAAPATVRVRISAQPKHAEITLDGRAIPNPFEADVVVSGKHRVQASALGHRSADVTIAFDQDQKLALKLERVTPPKRAKPERARPTHSAPAQSSRGAGFVSESPY